MNASNDNFISHSWIFNFYEPIKTLHSYMSHSSIIKQQPIFRVIKNLTKKTQNRSVKFQNVKFQNTNFNLKTSNGLDKK